MNARDEMISLGQADEPATQLQQVALYAAFLPWCLSQAREKLEMLPSFKKLDRLSGVLEKRWRAILDGYVAVECSAAGDALREELMTKLREIDDAKAAVRDVWWQRRGQEEYIDFLEWWRPQLIDELKRLQERARP